MFDAIQSLLGVSGPVFEPVVAVCSCVVVFLVIDKLTAFILGFFKR